MDHLETALWPPWEDVWVETSEHDSGERDPAVVLHVFAVSVFRVACLSRGFAVCGSRTLQEWAAAGLLAHVWDSLFQAPSIVHTEIGNRD